MQAPRFVAKAALDWSQGNLSAELGVRSLGERYASEEERNIRLSGYTVADLGARYSVGPLEIGAILENLTGRDWRSSEFFYASCAVLELGIDPRCPAGGGGPGIEDAHFTPGNPRNLRVWLRYAF